MLPLPPPPPPPLPPLGPHSLHVPGFFSVSTKTTAHTHTREQSVWLLCPTSPSLSKQRMGLQVRCAARHGLPGAHLGDSGTSTGGSPCTRPTGTPTSRTGSVTASLSLVSLSLTSLQCNDPVCPQHVRIDRWKYEESAMYWCTGTWPHQG